jgi:thiol-disulfide isomerase/thioredoxin
MVSRLMMLMKKLTFLLLLCGKAYGKDNVFIHGKITNRLSDTVTFREWAAKASGSYNTYHAVLDKNGGFNTSFCAPEGFTEVRLEHGDQQTTLIIYNGADLSLTLDAQHFDSSLHYEGKGMELANFMARHVLELSGEDDFIDQAQMLYHLEPAEFEEGLKKLEDKELLFLEKYGKHLPASFAKYYKASLDYSRYSIMHLYPYKHEVSKQKNMNIERIPKENYAVINDIPADFNDEYINMPAYQEYLTNFYTTQILKARAEADVTEDVEWPADTILSMAYKGMPTKTAEYFAGNHIFGSMRYKPTDVLERELAVYKAKFPRSSNVAIVQEALLGKKKMAVSKQAEDFDIITPEGKSMKLSDLKGNVVYIDFWSRGCAPCLAEMKDAKKIREHFKDKPVRFVYISLDNDDKTWTDAIKQFEINGINTRPAKGSDLEKKYGANAIPAHFLLDKEGKFAIETDNVARPTNSKTLIEQIEKLLQ